MKIGDSPPTPPGADPPRTQEPGAREAPAPSGETFSERLEDARPPEADPAVDGLDGATAAEPDPSTGESALVDMAARVDQGQLSAQEAVQLVVERVLDAQLPPDASPVVRQRVRALVEASLETDPLLSSLVKRLGGDS